MEIVEIEEIPEEISEENYIIEVWMKLINMNYIIHI